MQLKRIITILIQAKSSISKTTNTLSLDNTKYMPRYEQIPEILAIRVSSDDLVWLKERASALKLRPAIYARILLSKAVEMDKREPGKLLC